MTVTLAIKVHDGLVVAADSATTLTIPDGGGGARFVNVFNHANKIVHLHKRLPIALMTWGRGNIGKQSIAALAKDLRARLDGSTGFSEWTINPDDYQIADVASRVRDFFLEELRSPEPSPVKQSEDLGLFVGGFSCGARVSESFMISASETSCLGPVPALAFEAGAQWWGQQDAISRLLLGFSSHTEQALINLGVSPEEAPGYVEALKSQVATEMISPPMPIQDAIDLAQFLLDTSIKFTRFNPGADTVGGPIEIAAITRHEGFKWVSRKHYYEERLNPREVGP